MASPPGTSPDIAPDGAVHGESSFSDEYLRSFTSLSQVDAAISPLLAQVASLRARRNELLAISRLPPEILLEIFVLCTVREEGREHAYGMWPYIHYVPTLVCHAWRDLAFCTPSLWTYIQCNSTPADVYKFLDLSKSSPLDVSIVSPTVPLGTILTILSEMHRMQTLRLVTDFETDLPVFGRYLTMPAPLLEDAYIEGAGSSFQLLESLFGQQTPRLRHISLKRCMLYRAILVTPEVVGHLQHLSLDACQFVEGTFLRPLCAALEQMHHLKTLEVRMGPFPGAHAELSDALERDSTLTNVRRLERLALEGSIPDLVLILEHLRLSDRICLDLHVFYGENVEQLSSFAHILANHVLAGTGTFAAQRLVIDGRDGKGHGTHLRFCVSAGGDSSPTVSLTLRASGSPAALLEKLVPILCAPFHFGSLREVTMYSLVNIHFSTLSRLLRRSKRVDSLTLIGTQSTVRMLMHELYEPASDGPADEESHVPFPCLEQLKLEGAHFRAMFARGHLERRLGRPAPTPSTERGLMTFSDVLRDIFVGRYKRLAVPRTLRVNVVKAEGVTARELRELSCAVGEAAEIVWDSGAYED